MQFSDIFPNPKPVIGCIHLPPLPGAPRYQGSMQTIFDQALEEAYLLKSYGIDGLIIENFQDRPFYPGRVPAETVAALSAIARDIVRNVDLPIGINVLRNDAESAMAVASSVGAHFIRVNVHGGAIVSEQGIIQGTGHLTTRLREHLKSNVLIFADVGVKHAAPLADRGLATETKDLDDRGLVDAIIVSGDLTGSETPLADIQTVRAHTKLPLLIGSGATPKNVSAACEYVDGLIVGSYFKQDGLGKNPIDPKRVESFQAAMSTVRSQNCAIA